MIVECFFLRDLNELGLIVWMFKPKGLVKLQDMIRAPTTKPMEVLLRQASPDTYKDVLKEVKAKEFYNLVIDTKPENMNFFLKGVSRLVNTIISRWYPFFQKKKNLLTELGGGGSSIDDSDLWPKVV